MAAEDLVMLIIIGLMGSFILLSAILNWNIFFENRKVKFIIKITGRNGARVFFLIFGVALIAYTIMAFTGIINVSE